jgi:GAF domain-containing protein
LRILFLISLPALLIAAYYVWRDGRAWLIPFYVAGGIFIAIMRFWKRASYGLKTITLLGVIYALVVLSLARAGLSSNASMFLVGFIFVAALFLGRRAALLSIVIALGTMGIAGWLFSTGVWTLSTAVQLLSHNPSAWLSYTTTMLLSSVLFVVSQLYLFPRLAEALGRSQEMAQELAEDRELAVQNAQANQLQAERLAWAVDLSHALASLRHRDEMVWRVVREITQNFDIYQVNLFLVNRSGETLLLAATAGQLGEELDRAGAVSTVLVGSRSAPGRAAQLGKEQMALPLPEELSQFPGSRVEISLPLSVRGEVLGVLDLHSTRSSFPDEELQIFRIIASQVSTDLDLLRLLEDTQAREEAMRLLYAQHTQASWRTLLRLAPVQSAVGAPVEIPQVMALVQAALAEKHPCSTRLDAARLYVLIVPLVAHDVAVGYLAFSRAVEKGDWDANTRTLMMSAAARLALALDNTRLLIEARRQALYDEQLSHLNDLIWQTPNPEVIMEQSVRELGRFLGAIEAHLYLTPESAGRRSTRPLPPLGEQDAAAVGRTENV